MNEVCTDTTTAAKPEVGPAPRRRKQYGLVQIHPRPLEAAPRVWAVTEPALIGRAPECLVRVNDGILSRMHARVEPTPQGLSLCDLKSRHGTFLEGRPVGVVAALAAPGSILRCGESLFLLVENPERYESAPHRLTSGFTGMPCDTLAGPDLWKVFQDALQASQLDHPIMILGESGSGKEIVARVIHLSRPQPGNFVAINLAAIPDGLFEAELFGYARGAFTGAAAAHKGVFREAAGGTLFLDEVGDLRIDLQVKLLRAVEGKRVRPLGMDRDVSVDARLISATSRDIEGATEARTFRRDLFYRLSAVVIRIPPLRERRDDILLLATEKLAAEARGISLSAAAAERLALGRWEGNVRELHHAVLRAMLAAAAEGATELLPEHLADLSETRCPRDSTLTPEVVRKAMAHSEGNATEAAQLLGVSRATLYNFCARQGIDLQTLRVKVGFSDGSHHPS